MANSDAAFTPLPWQNPATGGPWRDRSPVMLIAGGAGSGKSAFAAEKIHALCLAYPGSMGLIVRKMRESMQNSTLLFFESEVLRGDPSVRHLKSAHHFEYSNGSILAYGGMKDEAQRQAIRSIGTKGGVDWAWMEEANAFTQADFDELKLRMRGRVAPWTQIILTTNPDSATHWINQNLIHGKQASYYSPKPEDNPTLTPEYLASLRGLTGVVRDRMCLGKWVQAEGVIFPEFDRQIHVIDPFTIPREWRRIRVIDFGFVHPFCCQWWAISPDGNMYLYREIYKTRVIVSEHAERIKALSKGESIEATICDHDAEDRATLEKHGICTTTAYKDVTRGLQAVRARLNVLTDRAGAIVSGLHRLHLFCDALVEEDPELKRQRRPTCTAQEWERYVWASKSQGLKEQPVKEMDEGMDCTRYAVAYVDKLAQTGDVKAVAQAAMHGRERYAGLLDSLRTSW